MGDRKICGILVELSILGSHISRSICGFGLNINQERFLSDAPNPVSMTQLTALSYDVDEIARRLAQNIEFQFSLLAWPDILHSRFLRNLWRSDGELYPFLDVASGCRFSASILSVGRDGILSLADSLGNQRDYAFKEVQFLLD